MKTVTSDFKNEMTTIGRQYKNKINIYENNYLATQDDKLILTQNDMKLIVGVSDTEIEKTLEDNKIYNINLVRKAKILSTVMKELDFETDENITVGNIVEYEFSLKTGNEYTQTTDLTYQANTDYYELDDDEYVLLIQGTDYQVGDNITGTIYNYNDIYEWINYGKYIIYSKEFNEDKKTYNYVCYDAILRTMIPVDDTSIIQGISIKDALDNLANRFHFTIDYPSSEGQTAVGTSLNINYDSSLQNEIQEIWGDTYQPTYTGISLLPLNNLESTEYRGITYSCNNQVISVEGTSTGSVNQQISSTSFTLLANTTYTLATINEGDANITGTNISILIGNSNKANVMTCRIQGGTQTVNYTPTVDTEITSIRLYVDTTGRTMNYTTKIMLLQGNYNTSNLPTYEPYIGGSSPTPTYPQAIQNITGVQNINIIGKNIFDKENTKWYRNNNGDYLSIINTSTNRIRTTTFPIAGGKTYVISGLPEGIELNAVRTYRIPSGNSVGSATKSGNTFTLNDDINYIHLLFSGTNFTDSTNELMASANIQIEEGTTVTAYEAYKSKTHTINFGGIELCKIGTYQDYIYKSNEKWYKKENVLKIASYDGETITTSYLSTTGQLTTGATIYYGNDNPSDIEITDSTFISQLENLSLYNGINNINMINNNLISKLKLYYNYINYMSVYPNLSKIINQEAFTNTDNTYRDVMDQICQAVGFTIVADNNTLELKSLQTQPVDTIGKAYLKDINVSFGKKYGPINSLVLSRSGETDISVINDEESIKNNGLTQFTIKDNRILLFEDRDEYRQGIFNQIKGTEYYLNDFSSMGIGYLELMDYYNIEIDDNTYKCLMLNTNFKVKSGISEDINTEEPEETTNEYKTSTKSTKEVSFIVDAQNGKIAAKVSKGEVINEINLDETGASINAEKISLAGKTIALTSDDITINSTNFNVDKNGNVVANNATFNSGTFKGDLDTSENCKVGNDLYIGQNQDTSDLDIKHIWFDTRQHIYRVHTTFNGLTVLGDDVLHLKIDDDTDIQLHDGRIAFRPEGNTEMQLEDGYIWMADDPVISSDERLKENIKDIDTSWIDEIKIKEFAYKRTPDKKRVGVIAQDYVDKEYADYFLEIDRDGYYAIRYNDITNALIKYCQELKQRVDTLEAKLKEMEDK